MEVDLFKFINTGQFGNIQIGMSKSKIEALNVTPQIWLSNTTKDSSRIWKFGSFEFHFDDLTNLSAIYNDHIPSIDTDNNFEITEPWLFKTSILYLDLLKGLSNSSKTFKETKDDIGLINLTLTNGVYFIFENTNETKDLEKEKYTLVVLGIKNGP